MPASRMEAESWNHSSKNTSNLNTRKTSIKGSKFRTRGFTHNAYASRKEPNSQAICQKY